MYDKTYKWHQRKKNPHLVKQLEKKLVALVVTAKNEQVEANQVRTIKN